MVEAADLAVAVAAILDPPDQEIHHQQTHHREITVVLQASPTLALAVVVQAQSAGILTIMLAETVAPVQIHPFLVLAYFMQEVVVVALERAAQEGLVVGAMVAVSALGVMEMQTVVVVEVPLVD